MIFRRARALAAAAAIVALIAAPVQAQVLSGLSSGGGGGGGGGAVFGPTPKGTSAANPPVLIGGTVDGSATGAMEVVKVTADGLLHASVDGGTTQGSKAAGTAATNSDLVGCVYNSAGVTLTTGQQVALQCNSTGQLITSGSGGGGGAITAAASSYSAGAFVAGTGVDGWDLTEGAKGDTAYAGSGSASVVAILKGIYNSSIGALPTQSGANIVGGVGIDTTHNLVTEAAQATGGSTPGVTAALTNTATAIKASAGTLYKVRCYNPNASAVSVQIYNIASGSVTVGTSTAVDIVTIGATASGGWAMSPVGEAFSTAISYAATTTPTGGTAPGTALSCAYAYN